MYSNYVNPGVRYGCSADTVSVRAILRAILVLKLDVKQALRLAVEYSEPLSISVFENSFLYNGAQCEVVHRPDGGVNKSLIVG